MRAVQVVETTGPEHLQVREVPDPQPSPGEVLVEVHSVGVSFPDLLLSRGEYQLKPEPPFTLGVDVAGLVVSAPEGTGLAAGDRVAAVGPWGGASELAAFNPDAVFALPDSLSLDEGAALPMNYLTAQFALDERAGLRAGETVLVHGAAGGVGTATIQVARGMGARTIAVCSTEEKCDFARAAGADEAVVLDGFRESVAALTEGRGVDVVVDVVGGSAFTDSLRSLAPQGRLLVVGFAAGAGIPEVKVNRLLLNNVDVRGVGWGAYAMVRPGFMHAQWEALLPMVEAGTVKPPIGATYPLEEFGRALVDMDERRTLGKSVVHVREAGR